MIMQIISMNIKKITARMQEQLYWWGLFMDSRGSATCSQFFLLLLYLPDPLLFFTSRGLHLAPF